MMSLWSAWALLLCGLGVAPLAWSASQALRAERDSLARGMAVLLAQDMAHRLHLNTAAAAQYQLAWGQVPATSSCQDRPCSRTDWALADLTQWRLQVAQMLPQGDAWLQASGAGQSSRWLMLAWASDTTTPSLGETPEPCPVNKRCLTLVLIP